MISKYLPASRAIKIIIGKDESGTRLDKIVTSHVHNCSRSRIAALIKDGHIYLNKGLSVPSCIVKKGDIIEGFITPAAIEQEPLPENLDIDVLYEDDDIIALNKSPGIVVHPSPGHIKGTLINAVLWHCPNISDTGERYRPGIVHRLDKDTSGAILIAKNALAFKSLSAQFKSREISKTYLALVYGTMDSISGTITLPIGRHKFHRKKMSTQPVCGREAVTVWKVKEDFGKAALLEIELKTGRTHQIRVHCAAIGRPVVGDSIYGRSKLCGKTLSLLKTAGRQMLHSYKIKFKHPSKDSSVVSITAPVPSDMKTLIEKLRDNI